MLSCIVPHGTIRRAIVPNEKRRGRRYGPVVGAAIEQSRRPSLSFREEATGSAFSLRTKPANQPKEVYWRRPTGRKQILIAFPAARHRPPLGLKGANLTRRTRMVTRGSRKVAKRVLIGFGPKGGSHGGVPGGSAWCGSADGAGNASPPPPRHSASAARRVAARPRSFRPPRSPRSSCAGDRTVRATTGDLAGSVRRASFSSTPRTQGIKKSPCEARVQDVTRSQEDWVRFLVVRARLFNVGTPNLAGKHCHAGDRGFRGRAADDSRNKRRRGSAEPRETSRERVSTSRPGPRSSRPANKDRGPGSRRWSDRRRSADRGASVPSSRSRRSRPSQPPTLSQSEFVSSHNLRNGKARPGSRTRTGNPTSRLMMCK